MGGIINTTDSLEFIMAGADALSVGTGNFRDPRVSAQIVDGLEKYLIENKLDSLDVIRGII
jgi:dihydroorotate dehydrogenase (NAD+) catalytic subunit